MNRQLSASKPILLPKDPKDPVVHVVELSQPKNWGYEPPGWKPWTFGAGVLIPAIFFSAGLIVVLALLQWLNKRDGAIFVSFTTDGLSTWDNFIYRYLSTVVIVCYGMFWSWIDLDIKRLEPWLQLSRPGGVSAKESLLLHYPVEFLPFVPFKAAKQRQWSVAVASTIMVLIAWGVTPLQNGILNTGIVTIITQHEILVTPSLVNIYDQVAALGTGFMITAYSTIWLGQSLPAFTTPDYALLPFESSSDPSLGTLNMLVTYETIIYGSDLVCQAPRNVSTTSYSVSFDDGHGCNAQNAISYPDGEPGKNYTSYYIGYYDDPNSDSSLQLSGCPANSSETFLAIWKRSSSNTPNFDDQSDATALFCTPIYYQQEANATIRTADYSVESVQPFGPKVLLGGQQFNNTQFEYVLVNGIGLDITRQDIIDDTILYQDSHLTNMSLVVPAPNMMGFAIGMTRLAPEEYLSPSTLAVALSKAYKILFAIAVHSVMDSTATKIPQQAETTQLTSQAVTVVPIFAFLAIGVLGLVVALSIYLLVLTRARASSLTRDPDSLGEVMLLSRDESVQQLFNRLDCAREETLAETLRPCVFEISAGPYGEQPALSLCNHPSDDSDNVDTKHAQAVEKDFPHNVRLLTRPMEYSPWIGLLISACVLGLVLVLSMLRRISISQGGLPLPSQSTFIQQVLLNFIPSSIGTLMEPFWVLLSRLGCFMQPMEELRLGGATAKKSLLAKYTTLPPQLVFWRALRNGHYRLASLGAIAILANLLTVALSGIFSINVGTLHQESMLKPVYKPELAPSNDSEARLLNGFDQADAFYIATNNLTSDVNGETTPLPAWTVPHYYLMPLVLEASSVGNTSNATFQISSVGYGAELACRELTESQSDAMYELEYASHASVAKIIVTLKQDDGSVLQCKPETALLNSDRSTAAMGSGRYVAIDGYPAGVVAFELTDSMVSLNFTGFTIGNETSVADPCSAFIVKSWVRMNFYNSTGSSTFIICSPSIKSSLITATVSLSGAVLGISEPTAISDSLYTDVSGLNYTLSELGYFQGDSNPVWHNDTFATDWANYLIKLYLQTNHVLDPSIPDISTDLLDATLPPPSFELASNLTSEIYARLFAIQMSLLSSQLVPADIDASGFPATLIKPQQRVFMSENLYWVAMIVLGLDLVVLTSFYCHLPSAFLPRLPTSIASQIAYFAGSHVIDDIQKAGGDLMELDEKGFRYGYGKYIGRDGWAHTGIERAPYVTTGLDSSVERKRRWWKWKRL